MFGLLIWTNAKFVATSRIYEAHFERDGLVADQVQKKDRISWVVFSSARLSTSVFTNCFVATFMYAL